MKASRGEIKIFEVLSEAGVSFTEEYSFPDLVSSSGRPLRFDFAVFEDNGDIDFLIEYQGIQHYEAKSKFGGVSGLRKQQFNDMQKREYCKKHKIELSVLECVEIDKIPVSSTLIREKISLGKIGEANKMLGYNFGFKAEVVNGDKRGRTLGFPTINQAFPDELTLPLFGVYETRVTINSKTYRAITNIGHRPTFLTDKVFCETYIENFSGEVYGDTVDLRFIKFIREEKKFDSADELIMQIKVDKIRTIKENGELKWQEIGLNLQ